MLIVCDYLLFICLITATELQAALYVYYLQGFGFRWEKDLEGGRDYLYPWLPVITSQIPNKILNFKQNNVYFNIIFEVGIKSFDKWVGA
jgi:hypothetical protein